MDQFNSVIDDLIKQIDEDMSKAFERMNVGIDGFAKSVQSSGLPDDMQEATFSIFLDRLNKTMAKYI